MAECTTAQLAASVGPAKGTAGTFYYPLQLRNISERTCFEEGYPGVSLLAGNPPHQLGPPATRVPGSEPKVTLSPGATASVALGIVDVGVYPSSCDPTAAVALRIYPPNQTTSVDVAFTARGCANTADQVLTIRPFS